MSDPLADLKRRAYARPADDAAAAAAQAELARLAEERRREAVGLDIAIPAPARFEVLRRRGGNLLAIATVVALGAATVAVVTRPVDSLEVFSRPPAASSVSAPDWLIDVLYHSGGEQDTSVPESVRWLGGYQASDLFGYRMESGAVCMMLVTGESATGDCATGSEFAQSGVRIESTRRPNTEKEYITVVWGPTGGPRFSDAPIDEGRDERP